MENLHSKKHSNAIVAHYGDLTSLPLKVKKEKEKKEKKKRRRRKVKEKTSPTKNV